MTPPKGQDSGKQNFSISAYRVLFIFSLLVQHRALSLEELNRYLFENPLIGRTFNSETITKYINTLRRLGCVIPKASSRNQFKYELLSNPFPLELKNDEVSFAHRLRMFLAHQPDEELYVEYNQFLQDVSWMVDHPEQEEILLGRRESPRRPDELEEYQELVQAYKRYCKEGYELEIVYESDDGAGDGAGGNIKCRIEPYKLTEEGGRLYLLGIESQGDKKVRLDLTRVVSLRQLPSKIRGRYKPQTVVFRLYGRMAKTYRPYPDEEVIQSERLAYIPEEVEKRSRPDELTIRARTDDYVGLLKRLLKYNDLCEVISPAFVRDEMARQIFHMRDVALASVR